MPSRKQSIDRDGARAKQRPARAADARRELTAERTHPSVVLRRAGLAPRSLMPHDVLQLQRTIGNRAVGGLLAATAAAKSPSARPKPEAAAPVADAVPRVATPEGSSSQEVEVEPVSNEENRTGLPDDLKAGIESLSGISLDDVKVHYNASEPAKYQALAYTRGTDIHVAPGQERHLAHEAWHVVQQKEGRVGPTARVNGAHVNAEKSLESEADAFGSLASRKGRQAAAGRHGEASGGATDSATPRTRARRPPSGEGVLQLVGGWEIRDVPGVIVETTVQQDTYSRRKVNRKPNAAAKVDRAAYVANIPAVASAGLNLATIATKYRNEGFAHQNDADLRLAMVFGVNRYRDAQNLNDAVMATARGNFTAHLGNFSHFPVAAISFMWEPQWTHQNQGRTIAQVRHTFSQGGQAAADIAATQAAKFQAGAAQRVVPYGEIRDKIKGSDATAAFQEQLSKHWRQVYVHTGDADVTSLRVTGAAPGAHQFTEAANLGLFELMDQKLGVKFAAARAAAQTDAQDNPKEKKAEAAAYFRERLAHHIARLTPDVMTGGYDFRLPGGSDAANTSIDAYMTMLASRLDFTVRAAMKTLDARTVYFTEPNTFFNATAYLAGSFGSGHEEGRQMLTSLLNAGVVDPEKMEFYQGAAVGTDPTRFSVGLGAQMVNTRALSVENIAALFALAQSHARRNTWADQVERVATQYGAAIATGPLQLLYDSAFPQRMTNGSAVAIDALTNGDIDLSVNTYLQRLPAIYSTPEQRDFLGGIAKASGKATLAFLKSLIASWPGA